MTTQVSIFDGNEDFVIDKPIRLIECFAGYGSQHLALKYLGVDVESYRICEWAVKSIQAYKDLHFPNDNTDYSADLTTDEVIDYLANKGISANYNSPMSRDQVKRMGEAKCRQVYNNIKATHNLVNIMQAKASDLNIVERDKYCYIMTYSFPCQDLSKAGLGKGMAKDSGTRSGLLWEVERLLDECNGNLPQVLLMENVPDVIGTKNIKHFAKWLEKLESIGYKCYWKVLNGKDYGIPQNRERCFMVSILGDYFYSFAPGIKLEKRLKHLLETQVDEKFYLSDVALKGLQNTTFNCSTLEARTEKNGVMATLCARDYKDPKLVVEPQCIQVDLEQTVRVRKYEVDIPNLQKTLKAHKNLTNKEIAEKLNKPITEVEHWFRTDSYFNIPNEDVWLALKELLGITTDEFDKSIMEFEIKPNIFDMANRGYLDTGLSPTITTQETPRCVQQEPLTCAMRGRNPDNPSDRTAGAPTQQRIEIGGTSANCITTVQKDSLVVEPIPHYETYYVARNESKKFIKKPSKEVARTLLAGESFCGAGVLFVEKNTMTEEQINKLGEEYALNPTSFEEPILVGGIGDKKSNGGTQYYQQDRVYDGSGIAMCHPANLPTGSYMYTVEEPIAYDEQNQYFRQDGCVGTLMTDGSSPKHNNRVVEPLNLKQQLCNELVQSGLLKEYDVVNHSYTNGLCGKNPSSRQNLEDYIESTDGIMPTLTTRPDVMGTMTNYRIRKLTPKECWRLMGVKDEDFERVAANQSNSSLYHLAGDSIITTVLMAIFSSMVGVDWKECL